MGAEAHHLFVTTASRPWFVIRHWGRSCDQPACCEPALRVTANGANDRHGDEKLHTNSSTQAVNDFCARWCKVLPLNDFRAEWRDVRFYRNIDTDGE